MPSQSLWNLRNKGKQKKMNCAITVTLEFTQQRQTKEQKTLESKRLPFCLTFFQSSFSPLCADWSEACFPPADIEHVLNSAMCFQPAADKSEDVLRVANVITQSSCGLRSMVWLGLQFTTACNTLSTLPAAYLQQVQLHVLLTACCSQFCAFLHACW